MKAWLLIALLTSPAVAAQESDPFTMDACLAGLSPTTSESVSQLTKQNKLDELRKTCPAGSGGQCVFPVPEVTLEAGEHDGRAILRYGAQQVTTLQERTWSLEASVPFNQDDEEGVFASLKELNGDIRLSAELGKVSWQSFDHESFSTALCSACQTAGVKKLNDCSRAGIAMALKAEGATPEEIDLQDLAINDAGFGTLLGFSLGGKVTVARAIREHFDSDFEVAEDDRMAFGASLTGNFFLKNGSAGFEVLQKRAFEEADDAVLCSPIAESSLLEECQTKPRSRAQKIDSLVGAIDWKVTSGTLAFNPQLQYDFDEDIWAAQLPIYLVRNDEGQLTGGLRFGWRSDTDDFTAVIFIGQPLTF